jgi:Photosynthesis system II assembly factor YCF48
MKSFFIIWCIFFYSCAGHHAAFDETSTQTNPIKIHEKTKEWEEMQLPTGFSASAVTFGADGEIVLIGSDIRISKDNCTTWKIFKEGKGFNRCTSDGGKSFNDDCGTKSQKAKKLTMDDVVYNGDVRNPTMTNNGRLYFSTFYEHHGALWSISLKHPEENWFGLHFTAESSDSSEMQYWTTDNFIPLKNNIFVSASSTQDDNFRWLTTENEGQTWQRARFDLKSDKVFTDTKTGLRIAENQIERTSDGGLSWRIVQSPKIPESTFYDYFLDDKSGFVCGEKGMLAKTDDAGNTWTKIDLGITENLYVVQSLDENYAWVAGGMGYIFETADGGKLWKEVNLGFEKNIYAGLYDNSMKIDISRRTVWILHEGKVFRRVVK